MKAVVFDRPGDESVLRIGDVAPPELRAEDVRIRVAATSVNRADLLQRRGLYPPPPGASPVLGLECAGEVVGAGAGVTRWRAGARVMALLAGGGYAETVVVHAGSVLPVPDRLTLVEAAALPEVFLTAYLGLFELGGLRAGQCGLVHGGSGGVGTAAIQLIRAAGATAIVTAGSDERCRRCVELGAARAVNYHEGDFVAATLEATGGRGAQVAMDAVGADYLERNLAALDTGGRLVVIGATSGARADLDLGLLLKKRLSVIGTTLRARPVEEKAALCDRFWRRFGPAFADGTLRPVIDRVLPLEQAGEAHRVMRSGEQFGKIVLTLAGTDASGPVGGRG
ncbi:MAG: NAD(P)H-quinone oxidoreductase [Acidobacteria bacterium]|nr:NAD(P)H-quinone oxidoreductase [Acidobacteriota bacterium]